RIVLLGVGAAPGAVTGAKLGFDLGLAAITWLGLGFLVGSIGTGLAEVIPLLKRAATRAWKAGDLPSQTREGEIELAAIDLAKASGILVRVILEGIIIYLTRG